MTRKIYHSGFTLLELLVVVAIIGILTAVSIFALQGARESSRDARRKADLELVRAAIEIYRSDCDDYPQALSSPLVGRTPPVTCSPDNVYLSQVPTDPQSPALAYRYFSDGTTYEICAHLEQSAASTTVTCGGSSDCGKTCNYKIINP